MGSSITQTLSSIEINSSIHVTLSNNATIAGTLYLVDHHSNAIVVVSRVQSDTLIDFRLVSISAIKGVSKSAEGSPDKGTPSTKSTAKKSGASTPARRASRPETPQNINTSQQLTPTVTSKSLSEEGKALLDGLSKHLQVRAVNDAILISLPPLSSSSSSAGNLSAAQEVTLLPPYTKIDGQGEQIDKVKRILESERGIITPPVSVSKRKKNQRKDVKIPAKGG